MTLPLLGRRNELRALQEAVEAARRGETVVLAVEGPPGSGKSRLLDEFGERLQEDGFEVRRASAPEAGEARPGHVARQLRLEEPGPHGQLALLVDDAHRADPTSLGLLRRAGRAAGRLLVVAHQPVDGSRALVLRRLGEGAGGSRLLTLSTLSAADLAPLVGDQSDQGEELARTLVRQSGGNPSELEQVMGEWIDAGKLRWAEGRVEAVGPVPERSERAEPLLRISALGTSERKLVEAAALAGRPLPLSVISPLLGLSSDHTLQTGERLAEAGYLQQSRQGFAVADHLAQRVAGEMGEVRRAALLDDLADALLRAGWAEREPAVVGSHLLAAGRFREALPLLAEVGLEAVRRGDLGQALPRLDGALAALERTGGDPVLEGRLRLGRAQCYRSAGWSDLAAHDLEVAVRKLSGPERVDAFGWAAQIADDRQHLQEADRHLAAAEYEAAKAGEQAKLGSLLTLRARVLSRLGFPNEAHAALSKGNQLLQDHGNAAQRFRGRYNAAWTAFDQGRARQAEAAFEDLAQEAEQVGGLGSLADVEAWWARALFQVGHPEEALEVRRRALGHSLEAAASGPAFLSHMALAEGAQLFGRYQEALEAADEMLGLVLQQLPEWENAARYLRAQALLALGRLPEAAEEAQQAVDLCPPGIDGWRWRLKCRALQLEVGAAQEQPWPAAEALELTDHLLHSQWFLTAAHLMTLRGRQEKDAELAADAAALAVQLGVPMVAAEAAHVAELWGERRGAAVARMVKQVDHRVPAEWLESWRQLPWVGRALQAEEVDEEDYQQSVNELHDQMQGALGRIGLADPDTLLS
ncbi:MAG: AAA family ATPase, partial [Actinomycetota bacterium]|nr:AAA family ATPase [Actinomycetota bacterium]